MTWLDRFDRWLGRFDWSKYPYRGELSFSFISLFLTFACAFLLYRMIENLIWGWNEGFPANFRLINLFDLIGTVLAPLVGAIAFWLAKWFSPRASLYLPAAVILFVIGAVEARLADAAHHNLSLYSDGTQKFVKGEVTADGLLDLYILCSKIAVVFAAALLLAARARRKWRGRNRRLVGPPSSS